MDQLLADTAGGGMEVERQMSVDSASVVGVRTWGVEKVADWVRELPGLKETEVEAFIANEVDGVDMLGLDKVSMRDDLGSTRGHPCLCSV
jgi:hypothetical protein